MGSQGRGVDLPEGGPADRKGVRGRLPHPAHLSRILKRLGFSLQKPDRLPDQRDEDAIQEWKQKRWPELNKSGL